MADIGQVINVALIPEGRISARDNLNVTAIITSDTTVLSTADPYRAYRSAASVASDFGATSEVTAFANVYFSSQPNPVNAGGYLIVGYWRAATEAVAATSAILRGAELSEAAVIPELQLISDGSFDIDVDGVTQNVTGLNFQTVTELDDVVTVLNAGITGATVALDGIGLTITSDTTGATSLLTYPVAGASGTFVGSLLGLSSGTGATLTQGAAADSLTAEEPVDATTRLKAETNFYGGMFIDQLTSVQVKALATWAQANSVLMYDVFSQASNLVIDPSNVVWDIKLSSLTNYRMLYSKANNRQLAAAYMSRAHTVNFNAENSALTMQLKELPVAAESYSQTELDGAKTVGLDVYTTIKNTPVVLTSGANDFMDNRYNLIGYVDALQTDLFNLLKQTGTKIPQTIKGVNQLVDQCEKTTRGFVRAAVFAPGEWSSPDTFGDLETFRRSIRERGFYFLAGSLADQPQVDRQARKSPVIQGAVKNAGAIHSADVIVNFNA